MVKHHVYIQLTMAKVTTKFFKILVSEQGLTSHPTQYRSFRE